MNKEPDPEFEIPDLGKLSSPPIPPTPPTSAPVAFTPAAKVLEKEQDRIMKLKGVTMVGEGVDAGGRPAIVIGVKSSADARGLPPDIGGVPVLVQITGTIRAQ